ncbi:GNAT family N-acetyltransferase [Vogesella oryzae]|uniref:GNAT family N-acetyltransferase n=1 Tax=Vogesella oryzae TaxID=1735285 RepID=UPI0015834723|nr:GNAT family N-acetyltransferase [Vogesella oryzae]
MNGLLVRAPRVDDQAAWRRLWDGYHAFYGRQGPTALDAGQIALTWQRLLDEAEPMQLLLAELDGQLVGLAHCIYHRNTLLPQYACYLQDLYTAPQARGQGVARALIAAVEAAARAAGCPSVYWHTHQDNATARRLYDRLAANTGFIVYRAML